MTTLIASHIMKNYRISQEKIIHLFANIVTWCAEFSQFQEYITKHRKIQIYIKMQTNARYKIHNKSHSTELRLMHVGLC
jgi:hypothetical protein